MELKKVTVCDVNNVGRDVEIFFFKQKTAYEITR